MSKQSKSPSGAAGAGPETDADGAVSCLQYNVPTGICQPLALYHLARARAGASDYDAALVMATWPDVPTNGGDSLEAAALTAWLLEQPAELQNAVNDVDIEAPPPEPDAGRDVPDQGSVCPSLPESVRFDPTLGTGAGEWLDIYTYHASAISPMTPTHFHDSAALWLTSSAIARRLKLAMHFGSIYPNLFVFWLAPTTLYRKSTALDVARKLAREVIPHLLAPQDTTPEAFLSDLAGREPAFFDSLSPKDQDDWKAGRDYAAQKAWVLDEMSGLLAASGKDYNAGLVESLLRFYDCDPYYTRSTRGQGRVVVRNAYLSMIGASTPAAMAHHLTADRLWGMGWWPRFAILTPLERPTWQTAKEPPRPPELAGSLRKLYQRLPAAAWPDPPAARAVSLGTGVLETWERYNKALSYDLLLDSDLDPRLHGTYGRLPVQALKVALILAALDWPDGPEVPTIEIQHLARAVDICETWRECAHRALTGATTCEFDQFLARILRQVGRYMPDGATLRDLYKSMKDKTPADIQDALDQLADMGDVEAVDVKPGKKGGRPTIRYRLSTE